MLFRPTNLYLLLPVSTRVFTKTHTSLFPLHYLVWVKVIILRGNPQRTTRWEYLSFQSNQTVIHSMKIHDSSKALKANTLTDMRQDRESHEMMIFLFGRGFPQGSKVKWSRHTKRRSIAVYHADFDWILQTHTYCLINAIAHRCIKRYRQLDVCILMFLW